MKLLHWIPLTGTEWWMTMDGLTVQIKETGEPWRPIDRASAFKLIRGTYKLNGVMYQPDQVPL